MTATVERRLFEILGAWVPSTPEPEAKLLFRVHSFQHAWHAELWESAGGEVLALPADVVDDMARARGTVTRLAAAYRDVLPRLVGAYGTARAEAELSANGPVVRALTLMLNDDEAAIREGERVLKTLTGEKAGTNSP